MLTIQIKMTLNYEPNLFYHQNVLAMERGAVTLEQLLDILKTLFGRFFSLIFRQRVGELWSVDFLLTKANFVLITLEILFLNCFKYFSKHMDCMPFLTSTTLRERDYLILDPTRAEV